MNLKTQHRRSFCTGGPQLTLPKIALFRFKFDRFFSDQTFYEVCLELNQFFDEGKWRTFGGY
jgi:hypothetical protein